MTLRPCIFELHADGLAEAAHAARDQNHALLAHFSLLVSGTSFRTAGAQMLSTRSRALTAIGQYAAGGRFSGAFSSLKRNSRESVD